MAGAIPDDLTRALIEIGEGLALSRKKQRITQADMAERVGVSRVTISRMEKGDHRVSLGVVAASAWVLGIEQNLVEALRPPAPKDLEALKYRDIPERVRKRDIPRDDPDLDF